MKARLRKTLLEQRNQLSPSTIQAISDSITKKVTVLDEFRRASTIHCYLSLDNEISTKQLISTILDSDKKLVVPKVIPGTNKMDHILLENLDQLIPNQWGISEPVNGQRIQPDRLDLVITPMLGGDKQGNRIGYGKGFYDQFLPQVNCPKIGLMPNICLVDNLPIEPHDIKLDIIITENETYIA